MARKRARTTSSSRSLTRSPLSLLIVLAAIVIIGAMALDVPHNLWAQPGLADLRAAVLESVGLQASGTPQPTAALSPTPRVAHPTEQAPTATTASAATQPPTTGPADWYQVYFTTPKYPDKAADHHDGIDGYLVQLIGQAQHTIDVAAYQVDLDTVAQALLAAKQRGVAVRLVTETDYVKEKAIQQLKAGGVPVVDDRRGGLMHNKYVIVDGQWVWTGSWNLTVDCTYRNNNNAILIHSADLARNYETKFKEMFEQHQFGPKRPSDTPLPVLTIEGTRIENYFAPEDHVSEHIKTVLAGAQHKIEFLAFSFTDDQIGQTLIDRARAGVAVSGVMETRGSDTQYAEYNPLRQAGINVLLDGNPYTMHHKVFIVDDEIVVTGSFNPTSNADHDNDENTLIIYNRDIAHLYDEEFQRVQQRALEAQKP